jgi:anti-sigma factor RsiW
MISCQDCAKYLSVFLDDVLDVKDTLDIAEHLQSCTACADRVEAERTLRAFVRQHATAPSLPDEAKRRIIRRAMQAEAPQEPAVSQERRQRSRLAVHVRDFAFGVAVAAAVLLLFFGSPVRFSPEHSTLQQFVREASIAYQTYKSDRIPPEVVSTDDRIVTKWFNNHMGYQIKIPCITDAATKLLGGRLCRLLDRKTAAMLYQRKGKYIILFAFKGHRISIPQTNRVRSRNREFYVRRVAGRPVAMWQHGGIVYSMVGDLSQDDLLQVAATIYYR